ncbi:immunoglobulin domain-containing protein isoform X2 [Silurus meridionalis]|uniref:immunoglobulin domain-containing protein isoform X2 n=1 Tax=Silurus meridionalis TaxID=175797 RepID=UPI001EEBAD90|nr:immunoglobulin domain-containing protein isoform X2 [Silurus meridionalis]
MIKSSLCVFFIVSFLHTGISNSRISISLSQEGDNIILTCVLYGNESLTQINWEMVQGSIYTKLGIFHPTQGIHIFSEHFGKIKIQGKHKPLALSDLSFQKAAINESGQICCQFITFPSGILKQCTDISDAAIKSVLKSQEAEPHEAGRKQGLFGQFGALAVGCILSVSFLTISIYIFQRCFCRRQVLEIQHMYTDPSTFTEMYTEEAHEVPPSTSGFDPSKLYAKIKEDLYYGRLWKAYQGRTRVSTQGCLVGSRQIYYRLGENPLRKKDQENTPNIPDTMDTMTRSSSDSSN